jgi:hypothetical protein
MRLWLAIILTTICLVIPGSRLELAIAPAQPPPIRTPACPQATYADTADLLAVLPQANYDCTEQIAIALRPRIIWMMLTDCWILPPAAPLILAPVVMPFAFWGVWQRANEQHALQNL